ncbi:MAG: hypothetical protein AB1393_13355 [Candidatus Edwardsbacteria bacterium]
MTDVSGNVVWRSRKEPLMKVEHRDVRISKFAIAHKRF